jgi:hypothetical protein
MEEIINGVKIVYQDREKVVDGCIAFFDTLAQSTATGEDETGNENETADGDGLNN